MSKVRDISHDTFWVIVLTFSYDLHCMKGILYHLQTVNSNQPAQTDNSRAGVCGGGSGWEEERGSECELYASDYLLWFSINSECQVG